MPVCRLRPHANEIRRLCGAEALDQHRRRLGTKSLCSFLIGKRTIDDQRIRQGSLTAPAGARAPFFSSRIPRVICWVNNAGAFVNINTGLHSCLLHLHAHFRGPLSPRTPAQPRAVHTALPVMLASGSPPTGNVPADTPEKGSSSGGENDPLVQYVVVRRDLTAVLQWPLGAVVAQACHAAVDALGLAMERDGEGARRYLAGGSNMRTVVLQVSDEGELLKLRDKLVKNQIDHKLWQEEPEKIPTALASAPIRKSAGRVFKGLKLLS